MLHEHHIEHGADKDGEQRVVLPFMKRNYRENGDDFGDAVISAEDGNGFQTVDHQHHHNGRRQHTAEVKDGRRSMLAEEQKGQKADQRGDETGDQNEKQQMK